jgi:hypothetical protein
VTDIERQLLGALTDLQAAVANLPTQQSKSDLLPLFARIDQLAARLSNDSPPELRHFLQRKSYAKARQWLEDAQASPGSCGG